VAILRKIRELDPRALAGTMADVPSDERIDAFVRTLAAEGVRAFTPLKNDRLTRTVVDCFHSAGIAVWGTNTNDREVWIRLVEAGVDGIITDRPDDLALAITATQKP